MHHVLSEDHRRGGPFNKARLIQRAFDQIGGKDWILHLDADIVLPRQFRELRRLGPPRRAVHLRRRPVQRDRLGRLAEAPKHKGGWDNHTL